MASYPEQSGAQPIMANLFIDAEAIERFGPVIRHLAVGLIDEAVQVRLVSDDPRVEEFRLGPIQSCLYPPLRWPLAASRVRRLLDDLEPTTTAMFHALSGRTYPLAREAARRYDADLVLQVASLTDGEAILAMQRDEVRKYIVATEALGEMLSAQLGVEQDRITVIRPGVLAQTTAACQARPDRSPTLLCAARLRRDTGVEHVIEAVQRLNEQGIPLLTFLLGEGPHEDALRQYARRCDVASLITFASPRGNVAAAMRHADFFVAPAASTCFEWTLLQAMAGGMAVVAGASSVHDFLHHGETALVLEKPSGAEMAAALKQLYDNPDFARMLALNAQAYVKQHHSMSAMGAATAMLYRELALSRATFTLGQRSEDA